MAKKNVNRSEPRGECAECGKPLNSKTSNVHSECLEKALRDTEINLGFGEKEDGEE